MARRSGYKVYTKITQYFTDDNSAVSSSYVKTFAGSNITACGTSYTSGTLLTSSLDCDRFTECLYGSDGNAGSNSNYYFFASGSTSGSSCTEVSNFKGYLDTTSIEVGVTGSRLYVSGTLCPADQKFYSLSGSWYQVGDSLGTITATGVCSTAVTASTTGVGGSMEPCVGGSIDDHMGANVSISNEVDVDTEFVVNVYWTSIGASCSSGVSTQTFYVTIPSGSMSSTFNACSNGAYFSSGAQICGACISSCDNPNINIFHGC